MIDINEINKAITELENGSTNYATCDKLASLYIVRKYLGKTESEEHTDTKVVVEYKDILPSYTRYCNIKKKHTLGEATEELVINAMQSLSQEIEEFLITLYASTESIKEREILKDKIVNFISNH